MTKKLTAAGRRMLEEYLAHKARVEASKPIWMAGGAVHDMRKIYTRPDGRIFMTLAPGDGAAASTLRKLVRDGMAEGVFNWCGGNRWIIPTAKGLAALAEDDAAG